MNTVNFLKNTRNKVAEAGKGARKLVGATGLAVALSMSPAMAEDTSPTFTTFDGKVMTFQELNDAPDTPAIDLIVDNMSDEEYDKFDSWQKNIRAQENEKQARENEKQAQENEKQEELKLQKQKNLAIIDAAKEREANAKEREANAKEREANAKEREANAKEREANAKEREALYSDLTIMADIILGRNGGDITNEEISKSFQRIAKDSTINLSSKDRTVYEFLSKEYAQGRNITYVNKEIKTVIGNYVKELKPKIKNMSFSEEERQKLYTFIKKIEMLIKQ